MKKEEIFTFTALSEQESYKAYCKQMEKENSDYFKQQDQNELPW